MSYELVQPSGPRRRGWSQPSQEFEARAMVSRLTPAMDAAAHALIAKQYEEGYWRGDLTADISLEADYVLLQLWMHQPDGAVWNPPSRDRILKCCKAIFERQLPDGGFCLYPQGPSEINLTVKAYTALKLAGFDPQRQEMVRMRERALELGGIQACNSYTKINLSLFGLYPKKSVPTVPPEIVLLPGDVLYQMSSWTRAIVVPLSVVQAAGRERRAPEGITLEELCVKGKRLRLTIKGEGLAILFHQLDRLVKVWDKRGLKNLRAAALREAEHWMLDRTRYSDGLGAIYPSMMYLIMALDSLGYADDHPDLVDAIRHFDNLIVESRDARTGEERFFFQPCVSPVWDSAIAAFALGETGEADQAALTRCADWLISKEVRRKGDWSVKRPYLEPSGWAFEFANEFYPDIDDTAMVLLAFCHAKGSDPVKQERCRRRAVNWLIGMQSSDGGWAAFDADNNWQILNKLPFADHNAMLDPTCPDITGRVMEALIRQGVPADHPAIRNGIRYLIGCQETNGSWYGRWGVNYVYGTFLALRGLRATGDPAARAAIEKGAAFLRAVQNADGGWGEDCASYQENAFVPAPSTPSQTAWGLLGLIAAGDTVSAAFRRGSKQLLDTQRPDGTWPEGLATGTGFPNVFFLSYHLYRDYFPLMALAQCRRAMAV